MTHLRKMMLEELQRRNYAPNTIKAYVRIIQEFAQYFHRPPDKLGPQHLRQYQAHLFQTRKLVRRAQAFGHLKNRLQAEAGKDDWILLANLAFSPATHDTHQQAVAHRRNPRVRYVSLSWISCGSGGS